MEWTVVIPTKSLPEAKSRLAGTAADAGAHAALVRAIRTDTLAAARAATPVARIVLVVDRPGELGGDVTLVQTEPGLNAALSEGGALAARRWPTDGVAALVGDLPALRADELAAALDLAAAQPRAFVPDAAGSGTTLLTATPGTSLLPAFGLDSAARHGAIAVRLEADPGLRLDVDTDADLQDAARLGLGPATSAFRRSGIQPLRVHPDPA